MNKCFSFQLLWFLKLIITIFNSSKQSYEKCSFIKKLSFRNNNTHAVTRNLLLKKNCKVKRKNFNENTFNLKSTAPIYKKNIVNTLLTHLRQRKLPPFTLAVSKLGHKIWNSALGQGRSPLFPPLLHTWTAYFF